MLDAALEAKAFVDGMSLDDVVGNRLLALALVKDIEIIGEAASKVSNQIQQAYPDIPWGPIVSMRNRLIHGYFEIDYERVWNTVEIDLPPLIDVLNGILFSEDTK